MSGVLRECACCGQYKPYDPGAKKGTKVHGFRGAKCWGCHLEANREPKRRWREANPEYNREATRRWYTANPEYNREATRRRREAPEWDIKAIKAIKQRAEQQGLGTDHVFPILAVDPKTGLRASGLHRSWNLQPMDVAANKSKGNRFDFEEEEQRLMNLYYKNRFRGLTLGLETYGCLG